MESNEKNRNSIMAANILSSFLIQGLAFLSGPVFSSLLGKSNYGIASVYLTWVQVFSIVFSLQMGGTIANARIEFRKETQSVYQSSIITFSVMVYLCCSVFLILLTQVFPDAFESRIDLVYIGLLHGLGLSLINFMSSKLIYEFKAWKNLILSVTTAVLSISFSILLISIYPKKINYLGMIVGQALVNALLGLLMLGVILTKAKAVVDTKYWKYAVPIAAPTVFHSLATIILNQSDKIMIQSLRGDSSAGVYALACTFGAVMSSIWTAFNRSWVPFYYEYQNAGKMLEIRCHSRNYIELFTIVTASFMLLSREVFHIYANTDFWEGTRLVPLFAIGYYLVFMYSFPANYKFYKKKTKSIAVCTCLAAIINIILNYFLIKVIGVLGAVLATVVSHGLQFIFHYYSAKKISDGDFYFNLNDILRGFTIICVVYVICLLLVEQWYVRWTIGIGLGLYLFKSIKKRKTIY